MISVQEEKMKKVEETMLVSNRLFYMNDLKLFASGTNQFRKFLDIPRSICSALRLGLNLDK